MAEIRLNKLTKQFSIGLARLVEFLNEKGANVEMNPNAKISDEYLPAIEAKFGEDLKLKKDSEKVTIKLKEIIEMGSKKKASHEEEVPEREVVIKTNVLNADAPKVQPVEEPVAEPAPVAGPKVIDKIDLSQFEKKPAKVETPVEPVVAPKPEPAPVAEPVAAPTPAVEPAKPVVEEAPVKTEPREVKVQVEKLAGPKVVDKIDLSQFDKKKKKKKRERIVKGGSQKVDVTKVEAVNNVKKDRNNNNNNKGGNNADPHAAKNNKKNRRDKGGDKFKPAMTEAEQ